MDVDAQLSAAASLEDLFALARRHLLGERSTGAVARRSGLGESTVYAFRSGRKLSAASFARLVATYDPQRQVAWHEAWDRLFVTEAQARTTVDTPSPPGISAPGAVSATAGEPSPKGPGGSGVRRLRQTGLLVGALLAGVVIGAGGITFAAGDPEAAPSGAGCPNPPLETMGAFTSEPGASRVGVSVTTISYTYYEAYSPMIQVGAGLSGPVPGDQHLHFVTWADPTTKDSTPQRNPGNGRYYPSPEVVPTGDGCVNLPRGEMGYGGFTGMRVRYYLMLVPEAESQDFERLGNAQDGFTGNELHARRVVSLGYLELQTG
ncbi:hypothetical protein JCM9957A_22440 [Kineosporia succinea]